MDAAQSPAPAFPGLLTGNIDLYNRRPANFRASFLVHVLGLALVLWVATWVTARPLNLGSEVRHAINVGPISFLADEPGGHGGGGTHDKMAASRGALPRLT